MTPAIPGEFCARCGARSIINTEPGGEGGRAVQVYRCPNGHGTQAITAAPATEAPLETEPAPETEANDHEDGEAGDTEGAHIPELKKKKTKRR